jgi:hypothetical protein
MATLGARISTIDHEERFSLPALNPFYAFRCRFNRRFLAQEAGTRSTPEQIPYSIHNLLRNAVAFGPISEMEQRLLSAKPVPAARLFLGAELGCLFFKALF